MALARTDLSAVVQIGAATTTAVYTVGAAQTAFVKSLLIFNLDRSNSQDVRIHVVPNSGGSAGTSGTTTSVARLGIGTDDTFFFEPAYPIVLRSNGDSIQVENEGTVTNSINVLVNGDIEV